MAVQARERRLWMALAVFVAAAVAVGVASGSLVRFGAGRLPLGLEIAGLAVLLAGVFAASRPWWRRLDHMQRDMHLASWYWGASFGGGLALLSALAIGGPRSGLVAGAMFVWVAQAAGYVLLRLWWWLSHRSQAA